MVSILRNERTVVRRFREAGATSPLSARTLEDLHLHRTLAIRRLHDRAVLREASADKFYVDEEVWEALGRSRRRVSVAVLCLMVLFIVAVLAVRRLSGF